MTGVPGDIPRCDACGPLGPCVFLCVPAMSAPERAAAMIAMTRLREALSQLPGHLGRAVTPEDIRDKCLELADTGALPDVVADWIRETARNAR